MSKSKGAAVIMIGRTGEAKTTGLNAAALAPKVGMYPSQMSLCIKVGTFDIHNRCFYDYAIPGVNYAKAVGF